MSNIRKAKCNCLKRIAQNVEKQLRNDSNYKKRSGHWGNVHKTENGSDEMPYMNFNFQQKGSNAIHVQAILFSHCPFCGTPYHIEKEETNGKS
jgi:hypothetical protein